MNTIFPNYTCGNTLLYIEWLVARQEGCQPSIFQAPRRWLTGLGAIYFRHSQSKTSRS